METFQYRRNTQRCGGNKEEIWKIENLNLEYKKRQKNKNLLSVLAHHTAQRGMHFVIVGILLYLSSGPLQTLLGNFIWWTVGLFPKVYQNPIIL